MRHQKFVRGKSKPDVGKLVVKIEPGQKLLWQKSTENYGFDLNLVDASVQERQ